VLIFVFRNKTLHILLQQDSLALADEVIQGQRKVEDKDGTLTFYTYDVVSPVSKSLLTLAALLDR
jgi:hypothetical protein